MLTSFSRITGKAPLKREKNKEKSLQQQKNNQVTASTNEKRDNFAEAHGSQSTNEAVWALPGSCQ